MTNQIIRTPTRATGGLTPEELEQMKAHSEKWIRNALRTDKANPAEVALAVKRLYAAAGLKEPRVILVPSPLVMALAGGISAAWWGNQRQAKSATSAATYAATAAATFDATGTATDVATDDATDNATFDATYDATDAATRTAARTATDVATRAATDVATRAATRTATSAATRAATRAAASAATDVATDAATRTATDVATDAATFDATRVATDVAARTATRAAASAATAAATRTVTAAATRAATYVATDAATRTATDVATDAATFDATRVATDNFDWVRDLASHFMQTPEGTKYALSEIEAWSSYYQGGNMWAAWDCYLTAFRDVLGLRLPTYDKYAAWEECALAGGFRFMHSEFCLVSDFPEVLKIDAQNRPHAEFGPSHRWRDGWSLWHLHGVSVDQWMAEDRPDEMDARRVVRIENVDQRREVIRRIGSENLVAQLDATVLDTETREVGGKYELLSIDMNHGEPWRFLKMQNQSIDATHVEAVPRECMTVQHAINWRATQNINHDWFPSVLS